MGYYVYGIVSKGKGFQKLMNELRRKRNIQKKRKEIRVWIKESGFKMCTFSHDMNC